MKTLIADRFSESARAKLSEAEVAVEADDFTWDGLLEAIVASVASVRVSAVIEIAPLVEAMSSLVSPVISDASAPNTARVTVPEPSAVMSSCSVRSPAVSVISIAALLSVV